MTQVKTVRLPKDRTLMSTLSCSERKLRNLVSIATKTFLRPHKLKTMLQSIRVYYPDLTVIVADDSKEPLEINDSYVEYYTMPYGKVCPSWVGRHLNPGTRGPQSESGPYPGGASFSRLRKAARSWHGRVWDSPLNPFADFKFTEKSGHFPFSALTGWLIHLFSCMVSKLIGILLSDLQCLTV